MRTLFGRLLALKFRKKKRYRAKVGLYVVPENHSGRNQISDISMGGLSFYYVDCGTRPKKSDYLITLMVDGKTGLVQVTCRTISDSETGESVYQNQRIIRRSVQFERLNLQQKRKIRHLIRDYTISSSQVPI